MTSARTNVRLIVFDAAKNVEGVVSHWRAAIGTEPEVVTDGPSFAGALAGVRPDDALAVMTHGNPKGMPRFSSGGRHAEIAQFKELSLTKCRTLYLFSCYQVTLPDLFIAESSLYCVGLARTKTIERIIAAMADAPDLHDPEGVRGLVQWMTDHWVVHTKTDSPSDSSTDRRL